MDLNLVRVFVAIYETRSLTLAGERLHVTQSAVSQSLGRLRQQLDDALFERSGREMRPTPVADAVFAGFREAMTSIDRTLDEVHGFDAAVSDRAFRIALSELGEIGWMSDLFAAVHRRAPGVRVEVVALDVDQLPDWLARGTVDLAITPADLPGAFERTIIKRQAYVVVMPAAHPLADRQLTMSRYSAASRVEVVSDSGIPLLEAAARRAGLSAEPVLRVQHFATLPQLLAGNPELIATIPEAIANGWATGLPLVIRELPFDMPPVELRLYQRRTTHHMSALSWFFATVAEAIAGSEGEFSSIQARSAAAASQALGRVG